MFENFQDFDKFLNWAQLEGYFFSSSRLQTRDRYWFHKRDVILPSKVREETKISTEELYKMYLKS